MDKTPLPKEVNDLFGVLEKKPLLCKGCNKPPKVVGNMYICANRGCREHSLWKEKKE